MYNINIINIVYHYFDLYQCITTSVVSSKRPPLRCFLKTSEVSLGWAQREAHRAWQAGDGSMDLKTWKRRHEHRNGKSYGKSNEYPSISWRNMDNPYGISINFRISAINFHSCSRFFVGTKCDPIKKRQPRKASDCGWWWLERPEIIFEPLCMVGGLVHIFYIFPFSWE